MSRVKRVGEEERAAAVEPVAGGADKRASRARRRRRPVNLKRVQVALGEAIQQLEHYILEPAARGEQTDLEVLVKVSYALAQAASVFKTLTEASALEEVESLKDRVYALESDASRLRA